MATLLLRWSARSLAVIVCAQLLLQLFTADVPWFLNDDSNNSVGEIDPFSAQVFYLLIPVAEDWVRAHEFFVLLEFGREVGDAALPERRGANSPVAMANF